MVNDAAASGGRSRAMLSMSSTGSLRMGGDMTLEDCDGGMTMVGRDLDLKLYLK